MRHICCLVLTALGCLAWSTVAVAQSQLGFGNPMTINPASGLDQQANIMYVFTVKNSGSLSAADTQLVVTFHQTSIPIFASSRRCLFTKDKDNAPWTVTCSLGSIPAGSTANPATVAITLVMHPTSRGLQDVRAEVREGGISRATQSGSSATNEIGSSDMYVSADVSPNPATRGSQLTYTITVNNWNDDDAHNTFAVLVLPPNVKFVNASRGCLHAGDLVTCNTGQLAQSGPNSTKTVKVTVIPRSCGYIYATAGVRLTSPDPKMSEVMNSGEERDNAVGIEVFVNNGGSTYTACH